MFNIEAFGECIKANLKERRFGDARAKAILDDFQQRADAYRAAGKTEADAGMMAMRDTFDNMANDTAEKAKRGAKTLMVAAEGSERIKQGLKADSKIFFRGNKDGTKGSRGQAIAHSVKSMIMSDKRFKGGNYDNTRDIIHGEAYMVWNEASGSKVNEITIGAVGRQRGKAHLGNIADEIFGVDTGDEVAKSLAKGWLKVSDYLVDTFNAAGGSMRKLDRYLPQVQNAVKLLKHGMDTFVNDHMNWVDWNKTRWPDGTAIAPEERADVLKHIFDTKSSDGINKIDPTAMRGRGRSVGNALDEHRFLHFKDSASWKDAQEKYGDGTVFDVLNRHIGDMAHRTALVETFGPNPDMAYRNIVAQAKVIAKEAGVSQREINEMGALLGGKVQTMMDMATRSNPMNPESTTALVAGTLSNLTTAAVLGKAVFASIFGDQATTIAIRKLNNLPMFGGMKFYFDSILTDRKFAEELATTSGFIYDASINHMYSVERFNRTWNIPQALSRGIADKVLRLSGMTATTTAARFRAQHEMFAHWARTATDSFETTPYKPMLERYGVTAEEWDAFRAMKPYEPKPGVKLLRPADIRDSDYKGDKTALFRKLQNLVLSESRGMVPDSTMEAAVSLKGANRPDTLPGLILHSFSTFKNFGMTYMQMYAQYAMTLPTTQGRAGFIMGLTAATTVAGAVATQLSEIQSGRDPMKMDSGKFLLKAFLKGGGAGIYGDFLFSSVNQFGGGPTETVAGPQVGIAGDVMGMLLREAGAMQEADSLADYDSNIAAEGVSLARRYLPGSNLWWAQPVTQKLFWDTMEDMADPEATEKRRRRMGKQSKEFGNEHYWEQGDALPSRLPDFSKITGDE